MEDKITHFFGYTALQNSPLLVPLQRLKHVVSILLVALMLAMGFAKTSLLIHYEINKKAITASKCENRDKPEMHCNGQCYLSKQLKKAEKQENPVPNYSNVKEISPFVLAEEKKITFPVPVNPSGNRQYTHGSMVINGCLGSIFQPPEYNA